MDHTQKTADDRTGERRRKTKTDKISLLSVRVCARGIFYAGEPAVLFTGENREGPSGADRHVRPNGRQKRAKSAPVFKASKDSSAKNTIDDYERDYENQLKEILETIIGVEDVSIVVNVDATSLKVFEKNKTKKTPPPKKPIKKAAKEA